MGQYRYTESGLDNVLIEGVSFTQDDAGEEAIIIPNVYGLHHAIATAIITKPANMTGRELRFLRSEMGLTQAQLAQVLDREALAISRWERGEVAQIDRNAETIIRAMAREQLGLKVEATIADLARWSVPSAETPPLRIDGSDPRHYRPIAA